MNLESLSVSFADKRKLVDFLLRRANATPILLRSLKNIIEDCESLGTISEIFDLLNANQRFELPFLSIASLNVPIVMQLRKDIREAVVDLLLHLFLL